MSRPTEFRTGQEIYVDGVPAKYVARSWSVNDQAWYEIVQVAEEDSPRRLGLGEATITRREKEEDSHHPVQADVWAGIQAERLRQMAKFGDQSVNGGYLWLAILTEELGESAKALLHDDFGGPEQGNLYMELEQTAAVAVAWLEALRRNGHVD